MPGFHIERKNYLYIKDMMPVVIQDMVDNGFDLLYPANIADVSTPTGNYGFDSCGNVITGRARWAAILKPDNTVNSLAGTQDWVVKFEWDDSWLPEASSTAGSPYITPTLIEDRGGQLDVIVCTPTQVDTLTGKHTWFVAKFNRLTGKPVTIGMANQGDEGEPYLESLGMCGTNFSLKSLAGLQNNVTNQTAIETYYKSYEREDDYNYYDKDLTTDNFSFPAALRNRHDLAKHFWWRNHVRDSEAPAFPMSFVLSITERGFFFSLWEQTSDDVGNRNSWILIQRPVDHVTGAVYNTGKAPVHCMYQIMTKQVHRPWLQQEESRVVVGATGNPPATLNLMSPKAVNIRRFIVRESDIEAPYPTPRYVKDAFGVRMDYAEGGFPFGVPCDEHTVDYAAVINARQQVAITENNKYVITFPNGFNTARYAYTHELDLIAYTSADVISADTEVSITVYGEATPRVYKAIQSNGPNNTGMRILVLKSGGGIS